MIGLAFFTLSPLAAPALLRYAFGETDGPFRRARTDVSLKLEKFPKKIERIFEKLVGSEGKAAEGRQSGRVV